MNVLSVSQALAQLFKGQEGIKKLISNVECSVLDEIMKNRKAIGVNHKEIAKNRKEIKSNRKEIETNCREIKSNRRAVEKNSEKVDKLTVEFKSVKKTIHNHDERITELESPIRAFA